MLPVKAAQGCSYCAFVLLGCTTKMTAIIDFSDALVFAMALANVLALFVLAPVVRREVAGYWERRSAGVRDGSAGR